MDGPATAVNIKNAMNSANMKEPTDSIIEKCRLLCEKHSLAIDVLLLRIEAFLINKSLEVLTLESFGKFEQEIHFESAKGSLNTKQLSNNRAPAARPPLPRTLTSMPSPTMLTVKRVSNFSTPDDQFDKASRITYRDTPSPSGSESGSQRGSPLIFDNHNSESSTAKSTYNQRSDSGKSLTRLNVELGMRGEFKESDKLLGIRCKINDNPEDFDNIKDRYRYMFTTLDERAIALEKQFHRIQGDMCKLAGLSSDDLVPVGLPSQNSVWVCGRVCNDSSEGKLNSSSVILEGDRYISSGRKISLKLVELNGYSLFPGQIILVNGTNSTGREMVATRIIEGLQQPLPSTSPEELLKFHYGKSYQEGKPLSVITAAGPFTVMHDMDYAPFMDLLREVIQKKPDVLILLGPFVDISQPIISSGDVVLVDTNDDNVEVARHAASYEMVFIERIITGGLQLLFDSEDHGNLPTKIILVPSLLDAHHEFVFPQPPFGDRDEVKTDFFDISLGVLKVPYAEKNEKKRVYLMPNPCMFRVNEVLFGATSNDALFSLASEEISLNTPAGARMGRLAGHLLQQQSFAPQFPPSATSQYQLDMRQAHHWQMKVAPDVLIVPSRMTPLAKEILGTLVVNPGQLAKGSSGGSYAEMSIHPMKEMELRDAKIAGKETIKHEVHSRTYVNILKI